MASVPFWAHADPLGLADAASIAPIGRSHTGEVIVRAMDRAGREALWALDLPGGSARRLSDIPSHSSLDPGQSVGLDLRLVIEAPLGDRGEARLVAGSAGVEVTVARLPPPGPEPVLGPVWLAGEHALVAIDRGPRRSLHAIALARSRARIAAARAARAYAEGDRAAAIGHYQSALEADPSFADAAYDLACLYAQSGGLDLATRYLELAVSSDPPRYRLLGRLDPDLAPLRVRPEIQALLGMRGHGSR